jgi:hypothetical protein
MRGAVLHKLGLNIVKERIMRRHYGVSYYRGFKQGQDPIHLKAMDAAGDVVCRDVMRWYAYKVSTPKHDEANSTARKSAQRKGKEIFILFPVHGSGIQETWATKSQCVTIHL